MKTGKPRQKYDVKSFDIGYNKKDNRERRPAPILAWQLQLLITMLNVLCVNLKRCC